MVVLWRWIYHLVLIESLVVATFIDFDLRIIPDGATLPAMAVGVLGGGLLGCVYIVPVWFQDINVFDTLAALSGSRLRQFVPHTPVPPWIAAHPHWHGLAVSLAGLIVGGGSIWLVRIIGHFVLKREAMGFGDVILMAMIGSFLGWQPTLVVFFLAPICALVVVSVMWIVRRDREIPYGPYLSLATLILLLGWRHIWPAAERFFSLGLFVPAMGVVMCVLVVLKPADNAVDQAAVGDSRLRARIRGGRHLAIGRPTLPLLRRQHRRPTDPVAEKPMAGSRRLSRLPLRAAVARRAPQKITGEPQRTRRTQRTKRSFSALCLLDSLCPSCPLWFSFPGVFLSGPSKTARRLRSFLI